MSKLLLSHRYFNRSLKVCSAFPSRKLAADGDIPQAMHPAFLNSKSPKQSAHFKCVRFFGKDCQLRMGQLNIFIVDFAASSTYEGIETQSVANYVRSPHSSSAQDVVRASPSALRQAWRFAERSVLTGRGHHPIRTGEPITGVQEKLRSVTPVPQCNERDQRWRRMPAPQGKSS